MTGFCLGVALLLPILVGCSGARPAEPAWNDPGVDLAWPEPPAPARIRFLRTLVGPVDVQDEGRGARFFRWITGEKEEGLPLLNPYGVAADGEGRVWVADPGSVAVHLFDLSRRRVDYFVSAGREPFLSPIGVAYDAARRRLYVSDSVLKKVFVLDDEGKLIGSLAPPGGFGRPSGLAADAGGRLYAVDVLRGVVDVFSPSGDFVKSVGSAENPGGKFNLPSNVFVDGSGRIFVVDSINFRIEILGPGGEGLGTIGGIGDVPGTFARPRGVAVDSEGHVYVADAAFDNIQIFDTAGRLLLYFGSLGRSAGRFNLPAGLFIDGADRLYVVDTFNHRVQVFQYLSAK